MQKDWLAIFKVKITARAHMIKYDNVYYIFWTADPFASKLGLIVHSHKPECFMEKLDHCVQGQGHSKISECQWMLVQMIFFWITEPFTTKLGMVMHHYEPDFLSKSGFVVFKVKVTVKDNIIKMWLFNMLSELLILLQVNLVWWHIIIRCNVLWKDLIAVVWSRSRSQKRFRIPVNVHLNDISSAAEPSVTKLGMVMQHNGPKYHARRFVSCLQVQGHSEGSFDQIWLFLPYLLNVWSFCNQIELDGTAS